MTSTLQLPKITKTYAQTFIGGPGGRTRRECWGATTDDGLWKIERVDDVGTPWIIRHVPTGEIVPYLSSSVVDGVLVWRPSLVAETWGTLKKALMAVASGEALKNLLVASGFEPKEIDG